MEVEMKIRGLMIDPTNNIPIVVLKTSRGIPCCRFGWHAGGKRDCTGDREGSTARPMTHDLIRYLLFGLEAGVKKVVVCDLKENTYYATIWVEREGKMIAVDSRPSDALAIALRLDCRSTSKSPCCNRRRRRR